MPLLADFKVSAVKTGMLPTVEVTDEVAQLFREQRLPSPVVDPVMQATSGDSLVSEDARSAIVRELFPLARLVTPNIPEAEWLTGLAISNEVEMIEAARKIIAMGARAVLIKGGHLKTTEALDVLNDEGRVTMFRGEMIMSKPVHGSGCTLSAAIAACLAKEMDLEESVRTGKDYVTRLIRDSRQLGHGAPLFVVEK
jgi:hydroxymethylpyrimidine kinase/phosphomethylpyrimidine kinase